MNVAGNHARKSLTTVTTRRSVETHADFTQATLTINHYKNPASMTRKGIGRTGQATLTGLVHDLTSARDAITEPETSFFDP